MIRLENVKFKYNENKKIFENLSLEIKDGERVRIDGGSGKGKTTLLRLIAGLEKAKGVYVKGKVSMVFQENRLIKNITALQNVALFSDNDKAEKLLKALNLSEDMQKDTENLSGGMARRVALARALSVDFDILLLDEPFTGLDTDNITSAVNIINEYVKGKTLVLVTHNEAEAEMLNCRKIQI